MKSEKNTFRFESATFVPKRISVESHQEVTDSGLNSSEICIVNVQLDNSTVKLTLKHIADLISGWISLERLNQSLVLLSN